MRRPTGRHFGQQQSACVAPAVADRDGVGAMYADENAHAHTDADARSIIITHTCTLTLTQTYISKCARTQPHTHARFHTPAPTDMQTHFHAPTGSLCCARACAFHRRETPLHLAAEHGHANVVAALLAHGADVHAKGIGGCVLPVVTFGHGIELS